MHSRSVWQRGVATWLAVAACTAWLTGCGDDDLPPAGLDSGSIVDAARSDGGSSELDAGDPRDAGDAATSDSGSGADATVRDAGPPPDDARVGADGAPANRCVAAGGMCVPVVPGACPSGIFGDPSWCTTGLGVTCCLPARPPPECRFIGTRSEGWYDPDGSRVCWTTCSGGAAPTCEAIGTRSEGWYTSDGAGCMMGGRLIAYADCG